MLGTKEAMEDVFTRYQNHEIAELLGEKYNTCAAWRWKFYRNMLSLEKQINILIKLNYQIKTNLTWKTPKNQK